MGYIVCILAGYLLGCSSMAYYLSKGKGIDLHKEGSGNMGASNTAVIMGWPAAILVGAHDIGKAALAVLLAKVFFPELPGCAEAAGVACVLGHIFPFYMKFKGGKGFASYVGMTLALDWKLAVAVIVVSVLITVLSNYIALATISTAVIVPVVRAFAGSWLGVAILCVATAVILFKHWENIKRMLNGTEIGLRSTVKGENRIK